MGFAPLAPPAPMLAEKCKCSAPVGCLKWAAVFPRAEAHTPEAYTAEWNSKSPMQAAFGAHDGHLLHDSENPAGLLREFRMQPIDQHHALSHAAIAIAAAAVGRQDDEHETRDSRRRRHDVESPRRINHFGSLRCDDAQVGDLQEGGHEGREEASRQAQAPEGRRYLHSLSTAHLNARS